MKNKRISVVVPVFNSSDYLQETVQSLLEQTYNNIEIVLVNDGSTDNSALICKKLKNKHSNVVFVDQSNQGAGHAMYNGALAASGYFLMFLDGDDWVDPEACENGIRVASIHDADIVFWSFIKEYKDKSEKNLLEFDKLSVFEGESLVTLRKRMVGLLGDQLSKPTRTDNMSSGWGKVFKRETLVNNKIALIGENDEDQFDVVLNLVMFSKAKKVVFIPKHFNHYRQYNINSITKNHGLNLFEKYKKMILSIEKYLVKIGEFENFEKALNNRISLSLINLILSVSSKKLLIKRSVKLKLIKEILSDSKIQNALKYLELKYMSLHWRLFFSLCRFQSYNGLYYLGKLMIKLR